MASSLSLVLNTKFSSMFLEIYSMQYKVLLDVLGDLFDVILFAVCLLRSDELWVYDQDYL